MLNRLLNQATQIACEAATSFVARASAAAAAARLGGLVSEALEPAAHCTVKQPVILQCRASLVHCSSGGIRMRHENLLRTPCNVLLWVHLQEEARQFLCVQGPAESLSCHQRQCGGFVHPSKVYASNGKAARASQDVAFAFRLAVPLRRRCRALRQSRLLRLLSRHWKPSLQAGSAQPGRLDRMIN